MATVRTPMKKNTDTSPLVSPNDKEKALPSPKNQTQAPNVRRSIGEWENGARDPKPSTSGAQPVVHSPEKPAPTPAAPSRPKQRTAASVVKTVARRPSVETAGGPPRPAVDASKSSVRVREFRTSLEDAKRLLNESRNLKTDIKSGIAKALENMDRLMTEEAAGSASEIRKQMISKGNKEREVEIGQGVVGKEGQELIRLMKEQGERIERTQKEMRELKDSIALHQTTTSQQLASYASVAAAQPGRQQPERSALHSIVIASKDETHTGDEVMSEIRKVVNAKDGWVTVERIRKVKDKKVIIGCKTEEERKRIKERLQSADDRLTVEEVKNQDPMLLLKDVLTMNSDEDVLVALRNQNREVFHGLTKGDDRMEIRFKKRARNPLTNHIAIKVSPQIYKRMMAKEAVHVDMQKVRVVDQSPLVQCSMCLAYGHGRRFCKDTAPKCSHCGGPHMRTKCPEYMVAAAPTCCNCVAAKVENAEHNAFSPECPVRRRWEALARAKVAYC